MSNVERKSPGGRPAKFRLDKENGKLAGVCAALARHFDINPTIVRVIFVVGTLVGFGIFLLIYLAIWLLAD